MQQERIFWLTEQEWWEVTMMSIVGKALTVAEALNSFSIPTTCDIIAQNKFYNNFKCKCMFVVIYNKPNNSM